MLFIYSKIHASKSFLRHCRKVFPVSQDKSVTFTRNLGMEIAGLTAYIRNHCDSNQQTNSVEIPSDLEEDEMQTSNSEPSDIGYLSSFVQGSP